MSDVKAGPARRRYRSPLREESARRTRQAVVAAARELFVARGYAATSLADVAAAAGVARPTVFAAFGSKAALLHRVVDEALAGDDEPVPVAERPWFRPVFEAAGQEAVLDAYARVAELIGARAAQVFETVRRAADAAPEAAELWRTMVDNRRAGARMVVERLTSLGPLAVETERAIDVVWFYNDPAHYAALVTGRGWPPDAYVAWLSSQMRQAVL
ncbi:TetR/AcrR family transcriptional regulator [Nonomuraea aridisoli]|uniref:TetR family transcriptional regulator n=1 Tax=Nonomuraea aridisoli TaxID=2070368 RepID=A0A2W2EBP8_9ACTN|nr:helix-turn-helix domain-containing protein [Nonomuraea aridisoli]PZG14279.1 TetR family transcriptional regulator [Nonomuraea aridisoli]